MTMNDAYEPVTPDDTEKAKLDALREAVRTFAEIATKLIPPGPDRTHALRTFRTAVFWMNYAVSHARKDDQDSG